VLSVLGLVALVYGIIDGGEHGFDRPVVWAAISTGVAVLAAFVAWELRTRDPSLDVRLFRNPQFATATGTIGLVFFAALGVFFFVTFYQQLVRDATALEAGLQLLPFAAAQLIFAPRSATMVRRYGIRAVSVAGLTVSALSLAGWMFVGEDTPIWVVLVLFFVQGTGMASVMPPAMEAILATLPRERAGVGSAISNTVRQVGGALGIAVLGAVVMAVYRGQVGPALAGLPGEAQAGARESIAGAYAVAEQSGSPTLIPAANDAFLTAMHTAAGASAAITAIAVLVALRWLPGRTRPAAAPQVRQDELALAEVP
jgi:MFS transporter, DHA2 family, multidrug resistance protein